MINRLRYYVLQLGDLNPTPTPTPIPTPTYFSSVTLTLAVTRMLYDVTIFSVSIGLLSSAAIFGALSSGKPMMEVPLTAQSLWLPYPV